MSNTAPVIEPGTVAEGSVRELAPELALDANTASGTIRFSDVDATDTHQVTVTGVTASGVTAGLPDALALLALLSLDPLAEPAPGQAGAIDWRFVATDAAFDHLADGEIATLTYAILIADGHGGEVARNIVVTVTGSNDAPVIDAGSTDSGAVHELAANLAANANAASGTIRFSDLDATDTHQVTVTGVTASGVTAGLPDAQALLALLSLDPLAEPAQGEAGAIDWRFVASDAAFDSLAQGEVATLTYAILIADGHGGEVARTIVVTVTGSNDAPVIDAGSTDSGAVHELAADLAADANTASGTIRFSDLDATDTHQVTVTGVTAIGVTSGLPDAQALLALLSLDPLAEPAQGEAGAIDWRFVGSDAAFDHLADGDMVTLTYAILIADGHGGEVTRNIVVTVTGSNDAPVIEAGSTDSGAVHELAADLAPDANAASGTIRFSDLDATDTHQVTVTGVTASGVTAGLPDTQALLALLSLDPLAEPAPGEAGAIDWRFVATDAAFDHLAEGEVATLTYAILIADGHGGEVARNIVVTVTGSNDAPVIDAGSTASGAVHELAADLSADANAASGTIRFSDLDATDTHQVTVTGVTASGVTAGLPDAQALLALLSLDPLAEPAQGQAGAIDWRFVATDAAFDHLADGEIATLTYAILIADGHGGEVARNIVVTVTGSNDAPVIDAGSTDSGAVHELAADLAADANTASGTIRFSDLDATDTHQVTVTGVTAIGVTSGLPDAQALLALLSLDPLAEPAQGEAGAIDWRFVGSDAAFDHLADGDMVTLTYAILIADGHGGEVTRNIVVTVTGSNDAPVIEAGSTDSGAVHELAEGADPTANVAAGMIRFSDIDMRAAHHVTLSGVSVSGVTSGLPNAQALLALLSLDPLAEPAQGQAGSVAWHFAGADDLFDYLRPGETATLSYEVTISDEHGGEVRQTVTIDAGHVGVAHTYSYSFGNGPTPWTTWMNATVITDDPGDYSSYTRVTLPGAIDPNHIDGIGPLWLISHLGAGVPGGAGAMDLRGAEISITIRAGEDFDPNGASLYFWICSYLPDDELQDGYYAGLQVTNWAYTGQNLASLVTSEWQTITITLDANPSSWTYAGTNLSEQGDWGRRYARMDLNEALGNVDATLHFVAVGQDINHRPSGQLEIENITVKTATAATPSADIGDPQIVSALQGHDVSGMVDAAADHPFGFQYEVVAGSPHNGTVTISNLTGEFVFTADPQYFGFTDTSGYAYFDYAVKDGTTVVGTHRVYVFVGPVAPTPETTALDEDQVIQSDDDFSFYLFMGEDSNASQLTYHLVPDSLSSGTLELDRFTGRYTYVPDAGFEGEVHFAYYVSNGTNSSDEKTVTLTVVPADELPVVTSYDALVAVRDSLDLVTFTRDLQILADAGNPNAAFHLGLILYSGNRGVAADLAGAAHYLAQATGTVPEANIQLAAMYISGNGVPRDFTAAQSLLQEVGFAPQAQYLQGVMAGLGYGVAQDDTAAAGYYLRAANQGNVDAMYTLGRRYLDGVGVDADPMAAYFWLGTALKNGGGGPGMIQFIQLLEGNAASAAAMLSSSQLEEVQSAVDRWHPGLVSPYDTLDDYSVTIHDSGTFMGVAYREYVSTYDFSGFFSHRAYLDAAGNTVAEQDFSFDGSYKITLGGHVYEQKIVGLDGGFDYRWFISGSFAGEHYDFYANRYNGTNFRTAQIFYDNGGHAVAEQRFAADGGSSLLVGGVLREEKTYDQDGGYDYRWFISGAFQGQSYTSYANHYDNADVRDRQTFYDSDGEAVVEQRFTTDGGVSVLVGGVLKEEKTVGQDGSYDCRWFITGAFLGHAYTSYANHYDPANFRSAQIFYDSDGDVVVEQRFAADGDSSVWIDGVLREEKTYDDSGGYDYRWFLSGTFQGESYTSYANRYDSTNFRSTQLFYASDGHTVAEQRFDPNGDVSLYVDGVLREQRDYDGTGGYDYRWFISGTFQGQSYTSYANHYDGTGFRSAQLFYDGGGHAVVEQRFTTDGGNSLFVGGQLMASKLMLADGGYHIFNRYLTGLPYTIEETTYSLSGQRLDQVLQYPDGDLRVRIFSQDHTLTIDHNLFSLNEADKVFDFDVAGDLWIDISQSQRAHINIFDDLDMVIDGYRASSGVELAFGHDMFGSLSDLLSATKETADGLVIDLGDHFLAIHGATLADLSHGEVTIV